MRGKKSMRLVFNIVLLLLPLVSGCSGGGNSIARPLAPAKGVVKYNGKPVAGAAVVFSPKDGSPAQGMTDKDGNFTITTGGRPGAEIGKFKVVVSKAAAGADSKPPAQMKPEDMQRMGQAGITNTAVKAELPMRYSALTTTDLEADVSNDGTRNVFEFNLVD
ncbi:MAG: hypothetical protein JWM11_2760 [Planctomycetaceae bacterium]|nr:hypothetical protein [Planctomycetaceae bacterium]